MKNIVDISIGRQKEENLSYLERHLAIDNIKPFKCFIGTVSSIKTVKDFFTKKYYPHKFLLNYPKTQEDYMILKRCTPCQVPNIQAIMVLAVIQKIKQDKKLRQLMCKNLLPYKAYDKPKKTVLFGKSMVMKSEDFSLHKYCQALNEIGRLLRGERYAGDVFTDDELDKIVFDAKLNPNLDLFHGTWLNIHECENEKEIPHEEEDDASVLVTQ